MTLEKSCYSILAEFDSGLDTIVESSVACVFLPTPDPGLRTPDLLRQSLSEVVEEVLGVFDAYRETYEVVGDADGEAFFERHGGM